MLILPGGMPGAQNLAEDHHVIEAVQKYMNENKYVAAICAALMILKKAGVSHGRTLTSYPADKYRSMFLDSNYIDDEIIVKRWKFNYITWTSYGIPVCVCISRGVGW